ncbi:hypothetical protein [Vibrio kanaloae]|uniref:hypothetical protein n=1 Tax=Vibrio kanaloae TaxID=170673 RepID=UPI001115981A|nr:hypothetical protein [Vibrio kanaloae]QPK05347.1 hypothetical protein BTD91_05310 [Vibrio kanaloae]
MDKAFKPIMSKAFDKFEKDIAQVWFFLVISIGSFKFFVFNSSINVLVVGLGISIVLFSFLRNKSSVSKHVVRTFFIINFFFILYFSSFFYSEAYLDYTYFFKILSLLLISLCGLFLSRTMVIGRPILLLFLLMIWGSALAAARYLGVITPSGAGALSYLNLALPIGMGIISSSLLIFSQDVSRSFKTIALFLLFFQLALLITLAARMVLISVLLLSFLVFFIYSDKVFKIILAIVCIISFGYFDILGVFMSNDSFLIFKITRILDNFQDEPRYAVYVHSLNLIVDNIFGYGVLSYEKLLGYYPHNIIIELFITAGFMATFLFTILLLQPIYFLLKFRSIKTVSRTSSICFLFITTYFFLQWLVSYDFSAAYVVMLPLIVLNVVAAEEVERK